MHLLVGKGITPYDAGEIWHLFDQRYDMLITKLDTRDFSRADLNKYTDIILPNSWGKCFNKERMLKKLKNGWNNGGTLIGYKNALENGLIAMNLLKIEFKSKKDSTQNTILRTKRKSFWSTGYWWGHI